MTIPNLLTILRVLLTPLLVIFLLEERLSAALVVFIVAGITDGLDGLIARLYMQKSRLGAFLDPLADKLLLATTYVLLAVKNLVPNWLTVIVLSRDVLIVLGVFVLFMQDLPFEIRPTIASKMTTCAQIFTAIVTMASAIATPHPLLRSILFHLTAGLTIVSWAQYMVKGIRIMQGAGDNQRSGRQ
ncbi:MAG: CDP-alcohol phosphatidyltransferase family protein [Deltaproteobacteria bacterium]|nr:MAG: CDP-alcohol phosphatidyltransferase family protein [Deltaproteobacteria bacterium]